MSNYQDEIDYEGHKEAAESMGWKVPTTETVSDTQATMWMNYWQEKAEYNEKIKDGNKNPGRPVVPHRSGH